jgi:hypothetical protein
LGTTDDESFIHLLWATHILQSDDPSPALKFFPEGVPDEAIGPQEYSAYAIHEWEIETLANELMTAPKREFWRSGGKRVLRWDSFQAVTECVNILRRIENAEYRILKKKQDVLIEIGRIAARQFVWQRGFDNLSQLYRNAFVYGQGCCASYFEEKYAISVNRASQIAFMIYSCLIREPFAIYGPAWTKLGVGEGEFKRVLELLSAPYDVAARNAREKRRRIIHVSDKPSVLRQSPCLRFGPDQSRLRAPLPELIIERVTSGIFYDLVDGSGEVRDDYGRRFENYCYDLFSAYLPSMNWKREETYRIKKSSYQSPDIIGVNKKGLMILIECKATRMSHEAMFGLNPLDARGYDDLVKAVFQIWRYFSHCRRGVVDRKILDNSVGVVLTLDNWLVMSEKLRKAVLDRAHLLASEKDVHIEMGDRRPVVFVAVPELERTLSISDETSFMRVLREATTDSFQGWRIDSIAKKVLPTEGLHRKPYPFRDKIGEVLPWWAEFSRQIGEA